MSRATRFQKLLHWFTPSGLAERRKRKREAAYRAQIDQGARESADLLKNKIPTEAQGRSVGAG